MTYTIRPCRSYPATTVLVAQEFDSEGRLDGEDFFCGYNGEERVKKTVKRALKELLWDERQGFKGNDVFVQGEIK